MQRNKRSCLFSSIIAPVGLLLLTTQVFAADLLFVSDSDSDANIATVLSADGHNVTTVLNDYSNGDNAVLQGDLAGYGCVVWAASGNDFGDLHNSATTDNLSSFVSAGGTVYVTGYDSVASPFDPVLVAFVGAGSSYDTSGDNLTGAVTGANILSTGLIDIQGVTPTGGYSDSDTLLDLTPDTTCVAERTSFQDGCAWSLRSLAGGQIAYVSNGQYENNHPSWEDTSAGGAGAYNASVRNFAFNCGAPVYEEAVPTPTMSTWSLITLFVTLLLLGGIIMRRRETS